MTRTRRYGFGLGLGLGIALGLFAAARSLLAAAETFQLDKSHTLVGFKIRHFVSKVEGRFKDFEGTIVLDRQNPAASRVDLTIQTASVDTAAENRDKHLKSPDFFDAEKFPTMTFKSTKVESKGSDTYSVTGDLTMRGVTKPVTLTVKNSGFIKMKGVEKTGFEVSGKVNRMDYGVSWNRAVEVGGTMLSDDVDINIQVEANKPDPDAQKQAPPPTKTP